MSRNSFRDESPDFGMRLYVVQYLVLAIFITLGIRFYVLQVARHEIYAVRADENRIREIPILATRGSIFDRSGHVLVDSTPAWNIVVTPEDIPKENREETIRALVEELNVDYVLLMTLPHEWPGIESSWHLYPVLVPAADREAVLRALHDEGIGAAFHYVPLHDSPYARARWGYGPGDLPVTERLSAALIRLPLFAAMSDADLEDVATATLKVVNRLLSPRATFADAPG